MSQDKNEKLCKALFYVPRLHKGRMSERVGGMGILANHPPILHYIRCHGSVGQKELAREFRVAPPTMTTTLKSLEKSGYVTRTQSEQDARAVEVSLTPLGDSVCQKTGRVFRAVADEMLEGFTEEEKDALLSTLNKMIGNLGGDPR